ncbi:protein of unknown function [Desulfocicer vacuolatum DSM 3385]|uniref:DUF4325 domain-containing protein n=1 Tax=Desulfocicer vacuolatum DSM 3385 TaxID=1121400 RepID=A0A1W2A509_9BACT|nr:STAS-like domain-containing protein [Desulfocicer vacuolatum]SMC55809.1 protein of unknown function [Desulfocicer vacuolatum DSM 3385]
MDTIKLSIFSIVGDSFCVAAEDGEKVFKQIRMGIEKNKKITLSFQNVEMLTTAFLNTAIGKLYGEYDEKTVKKHMSVEDMDSSDKLRLKRVIDTAKVYYANPNQLEDSIKTIMEED